MAGRQTKLTKTKLRSIYQAVRGGLTEKDACSLCRISDETLRRWKKAGAEAEGLLELGMPINKHDQMLVDFVVAVKRAELELEQECLELIKQAAIGGQVIKTKTITTRTGTVTEEVSVAKGDWQAAAWLQERKSPDKYGKRERRDLNIQGSISQKTYIAVSPEDFYGDAPTKERQDQLKEVEQ